MLGYGKMANYAIACMSYLAAHYDGDAFTANAERIAQARGLSKPLVSKVMSRLSLARLVMGKPGPGGGFYLAKAPEAITLLDIVKLFEKIDEGLSCPFGPGWCSVGAFCPLHYDLDSHRTRLLNWLEQSNLQLFADHPVKPDRSKEG